MEFDINMKPDYKDKMEDLKNQVSIRSIFEKFKYYWMLFLLSVFFCLVLGYLYIKSTPNQYSVNTMIFIGEVTSELTYTLVRLFEEIKNSRIRKRNKPRGLNE